MENISDIISTVLIILVIVGACDELYTETDKQISNSQKFNKLKK